MEPSSLLIYFIIIAVLIGCSAFFSSSETAFTASSVGKMYSLKNQGDKRAARFIKIVDKKENLISFILLGNNMVNIFASSIAAGIGIAILGDMGVEVAALVMTAIVLIFAEILPKSLAMRNPEKFALIITGPMTLLLKVFYPFVLLVRMISYFLTKLSPPSRSTLIVSAIESVKGQIELLNSKQKVIKEEMVTENEKALKRQLDMIDGVLDLESTKVEAVMTHRKDVDMIDLDDDVSIIKDFVLNSNHTRIPLYKNNSDKILGILHFKNFIVLKNKLDREPSLEEIESIMFEPIFVSNNTSLKNQLKNFRDTKSHIAVVVDEYGSMVGIITLEDILEEIVGDIEDEHDNEEDDIVKSKDGNYIAKGACSIRDFNEILECDLPNDNASTIAGLIIEKAGRIPDAGEIFDIDRFSFEVLEINMGQIDKIRVAVREVHEEEED